MVGGQSVVCSLYPGGRFGFDVAAADYRKVEYEVGYKVRFDFIGSDSV